MNLVSLQRRVYEAVTTPLTESEHMRRRTLRDTSTSSIANEIIKPNDRLTSFERLEIYNRQYWFRVLSSFNEDFVGLRGVLGDRRFDRMAQAYLADQPSQSFTLRNLGARLEAWLKCHPEHTRPWKALAIDMARLEWADTEAFDAAEEPPLAPEDLQDLNPHSRLRLQPYLRLLSLEHPVDELLLSIRNRHDLQREETSNSFMRPRGRVEIKNCRRGVPQRILLAVHRSNFLVYFKRLDREAYTLLCSLQQDDSLTEAMERAFENSVWPKNHILQLTRNWFQQWALWGWFCRPGETQEAGNFI